ncbi:MAG: Smr/MutS family protein [Caldimicrobium sp.]
MPKLFEKLGELFGFPPISKNQEDTSFPFKVKSWDELVANVKPLKDKNYHYTLSPKKPIFHKEKQWPPQKLEVNLSLTSEYIEGKKSWVSKEILWKLREGKFSVQASLNLRGLFVEEAKILFEEFIKNSLLKGYSCVLIIHGRGLSSKAEPVLKNKVKEWLLKGPYRKYVLAFATARPCDGGLGATYVLLDSKSFKK